MTLASSFPRVALACTGLGRVARGYEAFTLELFEAFGENSKIHLYQGGKPKSHPRKTFVRNIPRDPLFNLVPRIAATTAYRLEQETFAINLYPRLRQRDVEVVHFSDWGLGLRLSRLRNRFGGSFKLLFSNGGGFAPSDYSGFDFVHLISSTQMIRAQDERVPKPKTFFVPYGVQARDFERPASFDRANSRRDLGLPDDRPVILCAAALNFSHKRLDWLISEVSAMHPAPFLVLAGAEDVEMQLVEAMARDLLPSSHMILRNVPFARMRELYWTADVFSLATIHEAFGRVIIEAALAGVPAIVHGDPHFRWLLSHEASFVDLSIAGQLRTRLDQFLRSEQLRQEVIAQNLGHARATFSWESLLTDYLRMYKTVAGAPLPKA